jgi:aryl-alcohol dehydrogenase-like predicted oxidoreductase
LRAAASRGTHDSYGGAIWRRLREHLAEGTIHALGVSAQTPVEALTALGEAAVTHIQLPFNILDWRWRKAGVIAALKARPSVTEHVRSVFLQGVLTAGDPKNWPRISGVDAPATIARLTQTAEVYRRDSVADLASLCPRTELDRRRSGWSGNRRPARRESEALQLSSSPC